MKINLQTQKKNRKPLIIRDIPTVDENGIVTSTKQIDLRGSSLIIYVNDSDANLLKIGDSVYINRYIDGKNICSSEMHVISNINNMISLDIPSSSGAFYITSVSDFADDGILYYKIILDRPHNIIQNDLFLLDDPHILLTDPNTGNEVKIRNFFVVNDSNDIGEEYVIYVNVSELYDGNDCAPSTNGLCVPEAGMIIETDYNPYYYFKDGSYHLFGGEDDSSEVVFSIKSSFLNLQVGFSESTDFAMLRQHEFVLEEFEKISKNTIPGVIDMEKTKYVPYLCEENGESINLAGLAESIEFNLHFRNRVKKNDNSYAPTDRWTIQTEDTTKDSTVSKPMGISAWNDFEDYTDIPSLDSDNNFRLYQSDLVGNLGFTDSDVLNRRKKISKSFLRLSFYNSNNPLQTTMLFYSTIFMDSSELYSKYIKLKTDQSYPLWESEYYRSKDDGDKYDNDWGLVFFNGEYNGEEVVENNDLLTCKMTVSSEFDKTRSAEGYNLYLFADDAPGKDESRTIYLKIEFNHAGYGRTIPMILWPRDEAGSPVGLTRDNYYDAMYIPVEVMYNSKTKEYIYYIKGVKNDIENNKIVFSLFEPKFEPSIGTQQS